MSQELTLELSEQAFTAIQLQARQTGISPERLAATLLEQQFAQALKLRLDGTEQDIARARFEHHFGALGSTGSGGFDNKSIDADLAIEYGSPHEEE